MVTLAAISHKFKVQREHELPIDIEQMFGAVVCHVDGLHPSDYKPIFKREWAGENGVDIYFPDVRKTKSRDITLEIYMEGVDYLRNYHKFCTFMSEKKFTYFDSIRNVSVDLVFDGTNSVEWISYTTSQLKFKITFLNYTGQISWQNGFSDSGFNNDFK